MAKRRSDIMSSYTNRIEDCIMKVPENQLIVASDFYKTYLCDVPETAYYKSLERLSAYGKLCHLTKGIYCRPKVSRFGVTPISEEQIASHFTKNNQGIIVGYHMYNRYGISTQVGKRCEILTNAISEDQKTIGSVYLKKINFMLSRERSKSLEALEILQGFSSVEDASEDALISYMKKFAISYSDGDMNFILLNRKYKKSTIAFMEYFLNMLSVDNSLGKYLSKLSNYKIPVALEAKL